MKKKILFALLLLVGLCFVTFIIYKQIKLGNFPKINSWLNIPKESKNEPKLVINGISIRRLKPEKGYENFFIDIGKFKIIPANPELNLERRVEISGYILEKPRFLDLNGEKQAVMRMGFSTEERRGLIADVILGSGTRTIGVYFPRGGIISFRQNWTTMKVSDVLSWLRKGEQLIFSVLLRDGSDTEIFLKELEKGEGEIKTIGPVIQMIILPR